MNILEILHDNELLRGAYLELAGAERRCAKKYETVKPELAELHEIAAVTLEKFADSLDWRCHGED